MWILNQIVSVMVIEDPKKIEVSCEPTRKQILRLLSDREMTLTQIAKELGLTKRSVAYHLRILLDEDLITLTKKKVNEYGIQEKFYKAKAAVLIGDSKKSSKMIREETLESNRDVVMGFLCARSADKPISDEDLNRLVESFTRMVQKVSGEDGNLGKTRNQTKLAIYKETFRRLEEKRQWRSILELRGSKNKNE